MEHWQFLIQKQGARSWHILESPNLEVLEGQYRVLARSNLRNTDVEVRVTHSSTQQVQPTRRIFKRSRRTNSEGIMAVIPFTYFDPGVWELRCTGDLMSDILGKSWQYSVQLEVLPQEVEIEQGENVESHLTDQSDTVSVIKPAIKLDEAIAVSAELVITTDRNPAITVVPDEGNLEASASPEPAIIPDKAIAKKLVITPARNPATTVVPDEGNLEASAPAEPAIIPDKAIAKKLVITPARNPATTVVPD
ncbi:hypothetical protein VB740_26220, partial [Nostoc sp. UHCC 0251]|nr:hypothetical protein [Nostoc sp. UHCC 0251]